MTKEISKKLHIGLKSPKNLQTTHFSFKISNQCSSRVRGENSNEASAVKIQKKFRC